MATHTHAIQNPGMLKPSATLKTLFLVFIVVGLVSFGLALSTGQTQAAWSSWLINHFYFMSLAIGGVFFAAIQWQTNAMWSATVRRLAESFSSYLPVVLVSFLVLVFGLHTLYEWTHSEVVQGDHILSGKSGYLNVPFFIIRSVGAVLLWMYFKHKIVGGSIKQDSLTVGSAASDAVTSQQRFLSPAFLVLFALTFTLLSFDLMMSLQPHWFSTIFGVYCFAGILYSVFPLTAIVTISLRKRGYLNGIVNENHLHDLGKFMFAFVVFWAYIGFAQFMLIWYANLPEETGFFIIRFAKGWGPVSGFLLFGKFFFPFLFLLPRDSKRNEKRLYFIAWYMMVAQWIDVMWLVQPTIFIEGPHFSWVEIGVTLGFIGAFGLVVMRFLSKHSLVAVGDPRLNEAVHGHTQ